MSPIFDVSDLSSEGEQLRYRGPTPGAYKEPLSELRSWARDDATAKAAVHALTHHGWHTGGRRPCSDASSRAHDLAAEAVERGVLPRDCFAPGLLVGPQIVMCLTTLARLGAPRSALLDLWRCYGGSVHDIRGVGDDARAESSQADESEVEVLRNQVRSGNYSVPDEYVTAKTRGSAQRLFAGMVKANYSWTCAVTGIATRDFLVASHIVPWSDDASIRLDPSNGVCLSTFVDRAFDTGYLALSEDFRVRIDWSRVGEDRSLAEVLAPYDGRAMAMPTTAPPNPDFLRRRSAASWMH